MSLSFVVSLSSHAATGCDYFPGCTVLGPLQSAEDISDALDECSDMDPTPCCIKLAPVVFSLRDDTGAGSCIEIEGLHRRIALVAEDGPAILDASETTLQPNGARVLSVTGSGTQVYLEGLVLRGGKVMSFGGGISVDGAGLKPARLTMRNCTVQNCTADVGGGIDNRGGDVSITESALLYNAASGSTGTGGAIANHGALNLSGVLVRANRAQRGGGLYNGLRAATMRLDGVRLEANVAASGGAGLHNDGLQVVMSDTLFEPSTAADDGEEGAQQILYNGAYAQMAYHLPAPRGRYVDGVFECREQKCELSNGSVVPCSAQQCDWRAYGGVSMANLPQGSATRGAFPRVCSAGYLGDGVAPEQQDSPLCAAPCPAGHYCLAGATRPTLCESGRFSAQLATASADGCLACPAGFNCTAGSTRPQPCPGEVPSSRSECLDCPPGAWCNSGRAFNCTAGTYADPALAPAQRTDLSTCVACPTFAFTRSSGATALAECICLQGYFWSANASCQPCVIGMDCAPVAARRASTVESIRLRPQFWRTSPRSLDVRKCPQPQNCVGDGAPGRALGEYCAPGLGGAYCLRCTANRTDVYLDSARCKPCAASRLVGAALVGAAALAAALGWLLCWSRRCGRPQRWAARRRALGGAVRGSPLVPKLKQTLNFYQIQTHVAAVYGVAPPPPSWLLRYLDVLNLDPFGLPGLHIRCFYMPSFFSQLLARFFVPAVAIALVSAYHACRGRRERALPFALWLTFLTFSQVSTPAFQAFSCEHFDDGRAYLRADYAVDCASHEYARIKTLATLIILVYPVGVPLCYALLLFSSRRGRLAAHLGFLTDTYEERCFYWEVVEVARRLLLGSFFALPFMGPSTFPQLLSAVLVALLFLVAQLAARPFRTDGDTRFAALCSASLVAMLLCCVALQLDDTVRDLWAYLSPSLRARFELRGATDEGAAFKQAASLALIVANNLVVVVFAAVLARAAAAACGEARRRSARHSSKPLVGTAEAGEALLDDACGGAGAVALRTCSGEAQDASLGAGAVAEQQQRANPPAEEAPQGESKPVEGPAEGD